MSSASTTSPYSWRKPIAFAFTYCGAAWLGALADYVCSRTPPAMLDQLLHISAIIGKIGFLCCLPGLLRHVLIVVGNDRRKCCPIAMAWAFGAVVVLTLFALAGAKLAPFLATGQIDAYPISVLDPLVAGWAGVGATDLELAYRWRNWAILLAEAGFVVAFTAIVLGLGVRWRNRQRATISTAKMATLLLLLGALVLLWPIFAQSLISDYSLFKGGVFTDALALDMLPPFKMREGVAQIASLLFLAFTANTYTSLRFLARRTSSVETQKAADP